METKQCPVCWGKGVICVALTANSDPILELCTGCDGTGWLAYGNLLKEGEVRSKVITDNVCEKIMVKWDGVRFGLAQENRGEYDSPKIAAIVLNPREMLEIVKFACNLGGDCDKES